MKLKLLDVGKFAASSAVVYSSAFLQKLFSAHINNQAFYQDGMNFEKLKTQLCLGTHCTNSFTVTHLSSLKSIGEEVLFTVGAYKLVNSVFDFKSVHAEAGVSLLAGAASGLASELLSIEFLSRGLLFKDQNDTINYPLLVNMGLKGVAAAALAYINHDYSEDNAAEVDAHN